ncbi:MAG: trypsin-like peptidase domain-containing protein [Clostridia bacterium]|nr:trypsin-like peptidase domain-containing protein [Clostridia bacterium]
MEENKFDTGSEKENVEDTQNEEITEPQQNEDEATYAFNWNYVPQNPEKEKQMKKERRKGVIVYALVMSLAFIICFGALAAVLLLDGFANITETKIIEKTIYVRDNNNESGVLTIPEIADKVKPSVVSILTVKATGTGIGSGIIMSEDGYIATNAHVVANTQKITVELIGGETYEAVIVGRDEANDLAVLKIEATGLKAAEFGSSEELVVGELVVAIGTPGGVELAGTVTYGIISGLNRKIEIYNDITGALEKTMTLIQTSADITGGNSGGALVNEFGQVIGVNTLKLDDIYDNIGFAIPIDSALEVLNKIIENGGDINNGQPETLPKKAIIGIKGGAVSNMNGAPVSGVYISEIIEGYDAENHLKVGDIIVGINDYEVLGVEDISKVIGILKEGDSVFLDIYREGKIFEVEVKLSLEK